MLTFTSLKYALALKKYLHFGKAAEACFISQPCLSTAVLKLEESLGVNLFERHRKTVTVTAIGEEILYQAERVIYELNHLEDLAKSENLHSVMPLRLGAIYTVGPYIFPNLIEAISKKTAMPLIIQEGYTEEIRKKLDSGILDAAFIALPFEEPGARSLSGFVMNKCDVKISPELKIVGARFGKVCDNRQRDCLFITPLSERLAA